MCVYLFHHSIMRLLTLHPQLREVLNAREAEILVQIRNLRKAKEHTLTAHRNKWAGTCLATDEVLALAHTAAEASDTETVTIRNALAVTLRNITHLPALPPASCKSVDFREGDPSLGQQLASAGSVVDAFALAARCSAEGPGLDAVRSRACTSFTITVRNSEGEAMRAGGEFFGVEIRGADAVAAEVEDKKDGTYHVSYTAPPCCGVGKALSVAVRLHGAHIQGSPFSACVWNPEDLTMIKVVKLKSPEFCNVSEGLIYVTEYGSHCVRVLTHDGAEMQVIGAQGAGGGQFNSPCGIAVHGGEVLVADQGNNRVQVFSLQGKFLRMWGLRGTGQGQLKSPTGLAVSSAGEVYVVEWGSHRVQVFDLQGRHLRMWGSQGAGAGQFRNPYGVTLNEDETEVYVADSGNHRIQVFGPQGQHVRTIGAGYGAAQGQMSGPMGVTVVGGVLVVAEEDNHRLQLFSAAGRGLRVIGAKGAEKGQFSSPRGVAVDKQNGHVLVCDHNNRRLQVLS